jgi:hypothetical protein
MIAELAAAGRCGGLVENVTVIIIAVVVATSGRVQFVSVIVAVSVMVTGKCGTYDQGQRGEHD